MEKTSLRQANARAIAVGTVSEIKLEKKKENGVDRIEGNVVVKTSDINFISFRVYCNEKKNDGEDNPAFAGLETVMNEYKSIADVGEAEADKVRVNGQINLYYSGRTGNEFVGYNASYFTRIKNVDDFQPEAVFEVETFIKSILPEVDKEGEETGRTIIKGWTPTYNGIEPIELIADAEYTDAINSHYEVGQTVEFYGDIVNSRVTITTEKPVAFGKPKKEVKTSYVNELRITGGSEPYEDEEGEGAHVPYDADVVRAAVAERDHRIEEERAKASSSAKAKPNTKPSGAKSGRSLNW